LGFAQIHQGPTVASKAARFFRRWRRFAAFPPLRHCGLRSFLARKPRRCLESGSLFPPLAALRRFLPHRLLKRAGENFISQEISYSHRTRCDRPRFAAVIIS